MIEEEVRKYIHHLAVYCRLLILIIDIAVIVVITILAVLTIRDLIIMFIGYFSMSSAVSPTIILSNMFLLIIYVEIVRSIIVARRRPEMHLIGIAEAGFVISVKEIIVTIVKGVDITLIYPTVSATALAVILWILYRHILPHKEVRRKAT